VDRPDNSEDFVRAREAMVEYQLRSRGIRDAAVLDAMAEVPRHLFVEPSDRDQAYADHPLPIGSGQTISQPYMVARMVELCALSPDKKVLEIGTGSGYQTAVLARLCGCVYSVEIVPELARRAVKVLEAIGIDCSALRQERAELPNQAPQAKAGTASGHVTVVGRDGSAGWDEHAPYDAIVVAAGAPAIPPPLLEQLANRGRLVIPVGPLRGIQILQMHQRRDDSIVCFEDTACRFVDLQGKYGWQSE